MGGGGLSDRWERQTGTGRLKWADLRRGRWGHVDSGRKEGRMKTRRRELVIQEERFKTR